MRNILLLMLMCFLLNFVESSIRISNVPKKPISNQQSICNTIKFVDSSRKTATRESVLRELCIKGIPHVITDDKLKQFAIFNIHRDSFDPIPKWISGDAKDVINDATWAINEVTTLSVTGYQWYALGLPLWPLPHQTLKPLEKKKSTGLSLLKKPKVQNWPNYGIATPIYFASNSWRNQAWSMEEFFQELEKEKSSKKNKSPFENVVEFHKFAKDFMNSVNGTFVEAYNSWPFVQYSLAPMIDSAVRRNKGLCPDELYIYTRFTPCHPKEPSHLSCTHVSLQARNILTEMQCRTTDIIQGYSEEYTNNAL